MSHKAQTLAQLSDQFIEEALKWKGTPWVASGRSERGIDCLGLIIVSALGCGIHMPPHPDLETETSSQAIAMALYYFEPIPISEIERGCVLLMHMFGTKESRHVAIYDGYGIIHCGMHWGKVVHHRLDDEFRRRLTRAWKFKEELL